MDIKECSLEHWDIFVQASPQGTVFNKSFYLTCYGFPVKFLICLKGQEEVAGFAYIENDGVRTFPYLVYNGIVFKEFKGETQYRVNETVFQATEAFANYLFERYSYINFSNHWDLVDMRAFDWLNYHERQKGYYQIFPKYTSLLDISNPTSTDGYAHKRRIPELKKGIKEGYRFETKVTEDIGLLNRFMEMTFNRQNLTRSKEEKDSLEKICRNLLEHQSAKLLATYVNDEPALITCFAYDLKRAYYLFVGTNEKWREMGVGTKNLYEGCIMLHQDLGLNEMDMVGVNSPLRGSYKLSFGGRLALYFQVKKIAA